METKYLIKEYREIERKIIPIVKLLESKKDNIEYLGKYKGITTMFSPLIYKPKILFLGINPGEGRYLEINQNKSLEKKIPLRMLGEDETNFKANDWFKKNNARKSSDWYKLDDKVNNSFTENAINLLFDIAKLVYKEKYLKTTIERNEKPFWYEDINSSIMVTNLYPISTKDLSDLHKICSSLSKEPTLHEIFTKEYQNKNRFNNWDVRLFFIRRLNELIKLVEPEVIVCMGKTTFNDFTYGKMKSKNKIFEYYHKICDKTYPIIGFSRSGNWSKLMPELANKIVSKF